MKGKESAVANYFKSIPRDAKTVSHKPIMRDGQCVGDRIEYQLNGVPVVKEILIRTESPSQRR